MGKTIPGRISELDFMYENSPVAVVANMNHSEMKLPGLTIGPFEEGNEYEVQFWIARELARSGIVRIRTEVLNATHLYKIQWKDRVQTARGISKLPEKFYPELRRYLEELKQVAQRRPEKAQELEKAVRVTQDILNSRLKKIVALASSPAQTERILGNLADEERFLYTTLNNLIQDWKMHILEDEKEHR